MVSGYVKSVKKAIGREKLKAAMKRKKLAKKIGGKHKKLLKKASKVKKKPFSKSIGIKL